MNCQFCQGKCQKAGRQKNGSQKLYCKGCNKHQQAEYRNNACRADVKLMIPKLVCESVSIRGMARVLKIAVNTVLVKIYQRAKGIDKPAIAICQASVEVDELCTYIGNRKNKYWVVYALEQVTRKVIDFNIGKRTKQTLGMLIDKLILLGVRRICTDKFNIYRSLIPRSIHNNQVYCTNHIERKNLSIRTHLKRLSRRIICFSRSYSLLESCLRIYFWGGMHGNEC